jgi:alkylation response protein AidB-like acyl-CoA dehydrogenase
MTGYRPSPDDARFLLFDVLQAATLLSALPAFAECDEALLEQVLQESAKFVGEVVAPLHAAGDAPGCRFEQGRVVMPPGFVQAYRAFCAAGWPALACAPEDGGQGLPWVLEGVLYEMLSAANHGWTMAPGLLHGAYECLKHHGSAELKQRYLPKIASGEWLATMCLTEPQAGSDLGLARTQALPQPDGRHLLRGTKIFISGGEHDLTDNIVHLVLARESGAPSGPKGLSLFLAPKFLPSVGGPGQGGGAADTGARNSIVCERIEDKMGLHGSPTCVLRFDDALGWRVGEPGRGLAAMFVMMNAARLHVALQGIGLLDAAWQKAHAYAQERLQMRAPGALRAARTRSSATLRCSASSTPSAPGSTGCACSPTAPAWNSTSPGSTRMRSGATARSSGAAWSRRCSRRCAPSRASTARAAACRCSAATATCANGASSRSCATRASP